MIAQDDIREVLRDIIDPEIGLNIVDLGLVYRAERVADGIEVDLTMTTRACPLGEMIMQEARVVLAAHFPDVARVSINLVWEPPWTPEMMSVRGQEQLGLA